jgi:hypothetical protein
MFSFALKVAQVDLAAARSHMQQFQEISQANEAALSALNTTHDQYKADAEAQLARHEVCVQMLSLSPSSKVICLSSSTSH